MRCIRAMFCRAPTEPPEATRSIEPAAPPPSTGTGTQMPARSVAASVARRASDRGYNRTMDSSATPPVASGRRGRKHYDLQPFVAAQTRQLHDVQAELQAGEKRTHWMWYFFPQLAALGKSDNAKYYGLRDLDEARHYLADPVLGPRLVEHCRQVLALEGRTAPAIFGAIDARKFCSCMTLFAAADPQQATFQQCLVKYYGGLEDQATLQQLK